MSVNCDNKIEKSCSMRELRKRAKAQGLKFFYAGVCPHGHDSVRYVTSGGCVECVKIRSEIRNNDPKNRLRIKASQKNYKLKNKEKIKKYISEYYDKNKVRINARKRELFQLKDEATKAQIRERQRVHKTRYREKIKALNNKSVGTEHPNSEESED